MVITKRTKKESITSNELNAKKDQKSEQAKPFDIPAFMYEGLEPTKRNANGIIVLPHDDWGDDNA